MKSEPRHFLLEGRGAEKEGAMKASYWTRKLVSRRAALRAAAVGGGLAALSLIGCSGGDDDKGPSASSSPTLDSTKGIPGGTFVHQRSGHPASFALVASGQASLVGGLVHSGLLAFNYGTPPSNGVDVGVEPDIALALPEQAPDQLTYTFKLRPAKFHNGRDLIAADVKYSLERYAFGETSSTKANWLWLDRVDAPDASTVVVKTKAPYADALLSLAADRDAYILAKEFEEGPDVATKMMGSGPYTFGETRAPVSTTFRKNPNYYNKPYPYFDEIVMLGTNDPAKQIADFVSKSVHQTYWVSEEPRDQIKQGRPDAKVWSYPFASFLIHMRTDKAPFNDKRVRQALSMSIDRQQIRTAVSKGEGEVDQLFSPANGPRWGFRKPKDLGSAAKNWELNLQTAKQLLSAAGVTSPLEFTFSHGDPAALGQAIADTATLAQSQWRQNGVANIKDNTLTGAVWFSTTLVGNYEGMGIASGLQFNVLGTQLKNYLWAPPDGIKAAPTRNLSYINNSALSALMDKQLTQLNHDERKQTFRGAEDILADEMYWIPFSTGTRTYFTDPSVKNNIVPLYAYSGSTHYLKYQWFDKA